MAWLFVFNIKKLCLLKIVLFLLSQQCHSYEYGYHPSDEEFDSFLRESSRTWTRDLLANERRFSGSVRGYVPKYKYEREQNIQVWPSLSNNDRDNSASKHQTDRHDQQTAANELVASGHIGSVLDFTMFSDEDTKSAPQQEEAEEVYQQTTKHYDNSINHFEQKKNTSAGVVFNLDAHKKPPSAHQTAATVNLVTNDKTDAANFPIFFTNPVTGIVYAITEVGKMPPNTTRPFTNATAIPIYITKEQYDRDMQNQKKFYEKKCQRPTYLGYVPATTITSVLSHSVNTTERPQIIRLKKPPTNGLAVKIPVGKVPAVHAIHPPPVMVQTGLVVNDQVNLTTKRKPNTTKTPVTLTKKKKKKKNRSQKRPGRKSTTPKPPTTKKPPTYPYIVRGTANPSPSTDHLSTQLEKPNLPSKSTFNERPNRYLTPLSRTEHIIRRRSLENRKGATILKPENSSNKTKVKRKIGSSPLVIGRILRTNHSTIASNSSSFQAGQATVNSSTMTPPTNLQTKITVTSTPRSSHKVLTKRRPQKKPVHKKDVDSGSILDWFTYDDDDDNKNDDEDYAEDDDYYYSLDDHESSSQKPPEDNEAMDALKEPVLPDDSSAEDGIDIGALEEEDSTTSHRVKDHQSVSSSTEENHSSSTKTVTAKKRIRRRPSGELSTSSYEDYEDDDDDDGGGGGGGGVGSVLGGFFRMVFYPVQMLMSSMMDSFADAPSGETASDTNGGRPMYTQYNNVVDNADHDEDELEAETANSFTGWFSSLFGFNRRTKKIGSTPKPTEATPPGDDDDDDEEEEQTGWLDSWFGYGKSTTEATSYEDYTDDTDKWFFGWFDTTKTKQQRRRRTTTTTTTITPVIPPQVPILTIVDPLRNPQNWIGILAHHIINSTSTHNPLAGMVSRFTTVTPASSASSSFIDSSGAPRKVHYDNYQIWRLKPQNDADVQALEELKKSEDGLKLRWLRGPSLRGLTDVLVPPKMLIDFQGSLNFEGIAYEVLIFDVGKAIAYEKSKEYLVSAQTPTTKKPKHKNAPFTMSWNKYHTFDDIIKYLETIRMRQSQIVELIHIGRSYEGRPLVVVKIESKEKAAAASAYSGHTKLGHRKNTNQGNAVFIDSGTHGNEWIGPATTTWMISEVLRTMKSNKTDNDSDFIKNTTWYFMPVLNPDGYAYTHEYDRFWKKSRSRNIYRPDDFISSAMTWLQQKKPAERVCYGVDLQRNWQYQWGRRGSSKTPCNEFYAGSVPFSEPETKALSDFLMENRKQIQLYISMQAYGQIISYPSKANASFHSDRVEDFHDVAMVGIDGLRKKGSKSRYKVDSSHDLLESRSGCSDAFAAFDVGIPFSYTMQLADNGVHGYLLPSSSIEPTAKDVFDIVTAMLDYI